MSVTRSATSKGEPTSDRVEAKAAHSYTARISCEVVPEVEPYMPKIKPIQHGRLRSSTKPHYYRIFLWDTQHDYEANLKVERQSTVAMCVTDTWTDEEGNLLVKPKLGEIHFVSGTWSFGTVAHEVLHAALHRMRYLEPGVERVMDEMRPGHDPEDEEVIAYEVGGWVEAVIRWLAKYDPRHPYPGLLFSD